MRRYTTILVILSFAVPASAAEPLVTLHTVRGEALRGRLLALSLDRDVVLRVDVGGERELPAADVVKISFASPASPPPAAGGAIDLALVGGDRLFGALGRSAGETVRFETTDAGSLDLPLDIVAGLTTKLAAKEPHRRSADALRTGPRPVDDRVLLTNGDVVGGFVTALSSESITIDATDGTRTIPLNLVVAARFAAQPPKAAERQFAVLTMHSGARLTVAELTLAGSAVQARLPAGPDVTIDAERIASIDISGGRWEWLSRLEPASIEHTPMLDLDFALTKDRNVVGGPLMIAGQRFERGLGVHSRSRLIYELSGGYREFVVSFGVDDDSGPLACVDVRILVDGAPRVEENDVRPGKLLGPHRINLTGAKRLELLVDFGQNGDLQDRFDWVDAALVK